MNKAIRSFFYLSLILTACFMSSSNSTVRAAGKGVIADYDGDGKSDFVTVRPEGDKLVWWISFNGAKDKVFTMPFGNVGDRLVPADYDGDGKTDIAVWRPASATFYIWQSKTLTARIEKFGLEADDPSIVADYDGDGKADLAVYRAGSREKPQSFFYYRGSASKVPDGFDVVQWGLLGDNPVVGDFDGDGKADIVVRRPREKDQQAIWYLKRSKEGDFVTYFGLSNDSIVTADYDGDGKTDIAVWRSSDDVKDSKMIWYVLNSGNGQMVARFFGLADADLNVPGDYDGDGKVDIGLWRKTDALFWIQSSNLKQDVSSFKWGNSTDTAVSVPRSK